ESVSLLRYTPLSPDLDLDVSVRLSDNQARRQTENSTCPDLDCGPRLRLPPAVQSDFQPRTDRRAKDCLDTSSMRHRSSIRRHWLSTRGNSAYHRHGMYEGDNLPRPASVLTRHSMAA